MSTKTSRKVAFIATISLLPLLSFTNTAQAETLYHLQAFNNGTLSSAAVTFDSNGYLSTYANKTNGWVFNLEGNGLGIKTKVEYSYYDGKSWSPLHTYEPLPDLIPQDTSFSPAYVNADNQAANSSEGVLTTYYGSEAAIDLVQGSYQPKLIYTYGVDKDNYEFPINEGASCGYGHCLIMSANGMSTRTKLNVRNVSFTKQQLSAPVSLSGYEDLLSGITSSTPGVFYAMVGHATTDNNTQEQDAIYKFVVQSDDSLTAKLVATFKSYVSADQAKGDYTYMWHSDDHFFVLTSEMTDSGYSQTIHYSVDDGVTWKEVHDNKFTFRGAADYSQDGLLFHSLENTPSAADYYFDPSKSNPLIPYPALPNGHIAYSISSAKGDNGNVWTTDDNQVYHFNRQDNAWKQISGTELEHPYLLALSDNRAIIFSQLTDKLQYITNDQAQKAQTTTGLITAISHSASSMSSRAGYAGPIIFTLKSSS